MEEKILNSRHAKRALTQARPGDEEPFIQRLSWKGIPELLEF